MYTHPHLTLSLGNLIPWLRNLHCVLHIWILNIHCAIDEKQANVKTKQDQQQGDKSLAADICRFG